MFNTLCSSWIVGIASMPYLNAATTEPGTSSTWPQAYSVQRDDAAGLLTLSTPYYSVRHDLKRGGAIAKIRLTHGNAGNLLVQPLATQVRDEKGTLFTDLKDSTVQVSHRKDGLTEIVTIECGLWDEQGRASGLRLKSVLEYHWGYIKLHKELTVPTGTFRARNVCLLATVLYSGQDSNLRATRSKILLVSSTGNTGDFRLPGPRGQPRLRGRQLSG